jgi:splicing factor 3A subunit 1
MWIKERQKVMKEKQEQEEVYAPGTSIEMALKGLAERRTDIFGVGNEETQIGKKVRIAVLSNVDELGQTCM